MINRKQELISQIYGILYRFSENANNTIKNDINTIYWLRGKLNTLLTPEENYDLTSKIKSRIQWEANQALIEANNNGAIIGATGIGKTKIAIDKMYNGKLAMLDSGKGREPKYLLVVPTITLRDKIWKEELIKWDRLELWDNILPICYDSLHTLKGNDFDMVIFDEYHNFTENHIQFFGKNRVSRKLSMSATYPTNKARAKLVDKYLGRVVYTIDTDTSVKLGIINPYDIVVVNVPLDKKNKYIKAGRADKPFYTSEYDNYNYLTKLCMITPNKFNFLKRMRFIYNLRSKERASKWILDNVIPKDLRILIFCGSKAKADSLCEYRYYSKPSKPKPGGSKFIEKIEEYERQILEYQADVSLNLFIEEKINRLSCCEALNEGQNIKNIDSSLIDQLNSNELDLIQRIGRVIRYRVGHRGIIIIICANETVDKQWVEKATANLNINIRYIDINDLAQGKETITF